MFLERPQLMDGIVCLAVQRRGRRQAGAAILHDVPAATTSCDGRFGAIASPLV
jgi:hypothetical protein